MEINIDSDVHRLTDCFLLVDKKPITEENFKIKLEEKNLDFAEDCDGVITIFNKDTPC